VERLLGRIVVHIQGIYGSKSTLAWGGVFAVLEGIKKKEGGVPETGRYGR